MGKTYRSDSRILGIDSDLFFSGRVFCNSLRGESGDLPFSFLQCFALTSLSQSLAGVIPTPAGIGSVEAVFTLLFRRLLPEAKALSAVLLYRFATMLLPCAIGAFFVLGERIISLHRKKRTAD